MRQPLFVCATLALTVLTPRIAIAQDVTAPALKAAFIYNFVKFTEWPVVLPISDPFVICVIGDAAVGDALKQLIEGRDFAGRRIAVAPAMSQPSGACQVLYVSGATVSEAVRMVAGLQDSPVLTISDIGGFTNSGGMTELFNERGQLRFIIKIAAVERSGLKMSSRLLVLARR